MPDISKQLTNAGINLESKAREKFGAFTVDPPNLQDIPFLSGGSDSLPEGLAGVGRVWNPTPYSSAITSGAGNFDPRTKFLFSVEFQIDNDVAQMASALRQDIGDISKNLSFVIKQIDLPKFEFTHEEVNQYNFRTKILKQISHKELSFSFFDDVGNNALNFLNFYLKVLSPISRSVPTTGAFLGDHGMDFPVNYLTGIDSSNRAVLPGINKTNIIRQMKIHQIYIERSKSGDLRDAIFFNTYTFTNPRILSFDISDQDHESSNAVNILTAQFDYDAMNIETRRPGKEFNGNRNGAGDILGDSSDSTPTVRSGYRGLQISDAPPMDQYAILDAKMNSYVNIDSPTIDRLPESFGMPGAGPMSGADPMLGIIKNEVEKVIARKGAMSPLQNAIYRTMSGQSGRIDQGIALPRVPYVTDNSASANAVRLLTKKITSF